MSPTDLETEFREEFPEIFPEGCLKVGFWLPDDWAGPCRELCALLCHAVKLASPATIEVVQIKEKFGGLRFYFHWHGEPAEGDKAYIRALVDYAEHQSFRWSKSPRWVRT